MAQNIEIPVGLGLQNAQSQIAELRKMLQDSVNVKSDTFKDIQRFLDKISGQADALKGKMGEAFKTPNGSKNFLKQYEQLMGMLEAAKDKFTNLGLNDIAFSVDDRESIDKTIDKIKSLQTEIANLENGKIGNLFDDKSIEGADKVTAFIEKLKSTGQDVSKITFSGLSTAINRELSAVNTKIQDTTDRISGFKAQISTLSGTSLDNITTKMEQALTSATDPAKSTFKTEKLIEYRNAVADFYKEWDQLGIQHNTKNDTTGNISTWLQRESQNIANGAENLKAQLPKCKAALQQLQDIKDDPALKSDEAKRKVQNIAESLGLTNFKADSFRKYTSAIIELRKKIQEELMRGFTSDKEVDQYAEQMITNLGQVFENVDINKVVNVTNLKNQLKAIFTEAGLDLKDSDLSRIINSLGENMDFSILMSNAKQAFQDFIKNRQEMVDESEKQNEALKQQQVDLQTASNAVQTQDNIKTDSVKQKQEELQQFNQSLQELINKYNEANGTHLKLVDDSQLKDGQNAINSYIDSLTKLQQKQKALSNVQMAVNRWMGFWQVLNMTKSAINDMKQHIQELDSVITSISVVTNFSQEDLWGQISRYSEIARQYGVAIKGVYEVSQIYYQQGLQQNDVMTLTTETLKMARIAGLDYATAADYMTTAIRGFKLEMTDAAHVTDVFSALAATTASNTEEIAVAISKTAASAEAVGASFEATSAMMATMISTTRESATNIGTALKSVISRYGEMTSDPSKTVDSEGEEMSLNRVDKALQTVGITIHDTAGQFRDFDDVMLELMEKWDSLDSLSQRYIATLMAGNRQQSRFLALVSNVDEYKKALQTAMDSEGTGELQTLKTLNSIDAKIEKMKVTIQEFYTSSGLEEMYKSILDTITNVISAANDMPKIFGKIPVQALAVAGSLIVVIKNALRTIIANIQASLKQASADVTSTALSTAQSLVLTFRQKGAEAGQNFWQRFTESGNAKVLISKVGQIVGQAVSLAGSGLIISGANQYGKSTSIDQDKAAGRTTVGGALLSIGGSTLSGAATGAAIGAAGGPIGAGIGAIAGALEGLISNFPALITGFNQWNVSLERSVELAQKNAQQQKTNAQQIQGEFQSLNSAVEKYKELYSAQYDSAEAAKEYQEHVNTLADAYPALISRMDETGNYIIELENLEGALAAAREKTAIATAQATQAELSSKKTEQEAYQQIFNNLNQKYGFDSSTLQSSIDKYKTNINTPEKLMRNISYNPDFLGFFDQYGAGHEWEALLQIYNNSVDSSKRLNFDGTENGAQEIIRQNYDAIVDFYAKFVQRMGSYDFVDSKNDLQKTIDSLQNIDSTLSVEYLTGISGLTNLNELKPTQIIYAMDHLQKVIQERIMNDGNIINNIADELVANRSQVTISKEAAKDITHQFDYDKHGKLISALVSQNPWLQDWAAIDTEESDQFETYTEQKTQEYLNYFKTRQKGLEYLENNLKLEEFNSWDEVEKVLSQYGQIDNSAVGKEIKKRYQEQWTNQRKEIVALYSNQLKNIFGKDANIRDFLNININEKTGLDNSNFTGTTLTAIQANLKQYQSLIEKQQYAQAEAYLNSMEAIYGPDGIGGLSGEEQTKAFDVIKDLDLSDPEQLRTAAETFTSMGGNFEKIASQFTNAASRWATNAATLLEQLSSSTQETAKSIESSTSDMSKVFKYSEALEKARALMDANKGATFDQLFTYDKNLGGYIKTAKAFQLEIAEFQNQQVEGIQQAITDTTIILPKALKSLNYDRLAMDYAGSKNINQNIAQRSVREGKQTLSSLTGVTDSATLDRLWMQYTQMMQEFDALEETDKDWNTFVDKYIQEHGEALQLQLDEINNMSSQMASLQLESFDYTSIVSGKGTAQTKETLKALIQASLKGGPQFDFNTFWTNLITGQIDNANEALAKADLGQISKGQANRARFEGLTSLYQKIASGDIVWDALTQQEQELLNSVEGVNLAEGASTEQIGAAANNVWTAITKLIQAGAGTLDEVADTIAGKADKDFKNSNAGKQYNLLTSYKDGFTSQEAQALGLLDDDGKLKAEFSSYLERDSNGNWVAQAGQSAASVIQSLAQLLNISIDKTTDEYKDAIKDGINQAIADADKADIGKQRTQVWQSVMSGKVGDRISLDGADGTTKAFMEAAGLISNTSAEFVYIQSEKQLNDAIAWMKNWLENDVNVQNNPQTARYFQSMVSDWEAKTAKNAAFEGIIGETVSKSAAQALSLALQNTSQSEEVDQLMESLGFKWDQAAQVWNASLETINNTKAKLAEALAKEEITPETYNQLIAKLNDTANAIDPSNKQNNAILSLLQSYTNISEEMRAVFLTNFSKYGSNIAGLFKDNGNGTFSVDPGQLISFLNSVGFEFNEAVQEEIVAISDAYLTNIKNAANYTIQGTTSLVEIDSFRKKYEEIVQEAIPENAFQYNNILDAWTLDPEILQNFVRQQALDLVRQGLLAQSEVESYINSQVIQPMAQAVDIKSFLESENQGGLATQNLTTQIQNLQAAVGKRDASYYRDLARNELMATKGLTFESATALTAGKMSEYQKAAEEFNKEHKYLQNTTAQSIINTLKAGGEAAIKAGQEIAKEEGRELTSAEVDQLYRNPVKQLQSIIDQVSSLDVGNVVSEDVARILNATGAVYVNPNSVIESISNLKAAYEGLYIQLKYSTDSISGKALATQSELNAAYVKVLEAGDQQNIDTKTALDNAAGMTYEAFSDLITHYGEAYHYSLEEAIDSLSDLGAERTGFGQIRVVDFNKFASRLKLNIDSPEYAEAYSKWVDSMAQLQNQPITVMNNAADQISNIVKAKPGEFVNIAYLGQELNDKLEDIVGQYGATLKDGLLELGSNADIAGLTSRIAEEAAKAGAIIPEKLGEIKDAVEDMLSNIASLLSNGISGKLNNSQASQLNEWAKQQDEFKEYFVNNDSLTFTRTTDGLKLATAQAIKLYNVIKNIDAIQGQNVLKNIMDTNDNYATVASTMDRIAELRKKIKEADGNTSSARIQQYQEELSLAQEILAIRSGTEDQSFNFMSNKIEGAQNNPLNYWKNWITAMDVIKKSKRSGSMGYQDFYNIVTEMGRLADITGDAIKFGNQTLHNSQEAANLIALAASKLSNVKGEVKIDFKALAKMGVDFSTGAKDMNESIQKGIQQLAEGQVSMLDAMIQLLETVVAMEGLGDVDTDMDMTIDIGEIFHINQETGVVDGFTTEYENWRKSINKQIQDELEASGDEHKSQLQELLKSIYLDDFSLNDLLSNDKQNQFNEAWWTKQGKDYQERFAQLLTAFYQAALSGEWDLSNYDESFKQELLSKMPDGVSVDLGDRTFYITGNTLFSIDWTNEDALAKFKTEVGLNDDATVEEAKAKARELIEERKNENITTKRAIEIDYALGLLSGQLTISGDDKHGYTGTYHGYTVSGNNLNEIKEKISEIIKRENEGFTVIVDSEGNITGTLKVGNAKIKVTKENGQDVYEAISRRGSQKFTGPHGKKRALAWLASQGEGEQGTYSFGGKTYNVFIDEKTQNTYSIDNDGKFHADGFTFDSYEKLLEYFTFKDQTKGGNYSFNDDSVSVISVDGKTRVTWHNNGSIDYEFWDPVSKSYKSFASPEDYQEYLKAWKQPNAHLNNNNQIEYNLQNAIVVVDYVDGKIHYTAHLTNGHTVEAWDEASLRAGIATASQLTPVEGSIKPEESGGEGGEGKKDGLHYKIDENFVVDVNATGTTVQVEDPAKADVNDKTQEQIESITKGQTYTAPAEKVEIDPTQATVELTKAIVALTEHLSGATAILSNLLLTTNNDTDISLVKNSVKVKKEIEATGDVAHLVLGLTEEAKVAFQTGIAIPTALDGTAEASAESLLTILQKIKNYKPATKAKLTGEKTFKDNANTMKEELDELASYDPVDISVILTGGGAIRGMVDGLISKVKELAKTWIITFEGQKTGDWPDSTGSGSDEGTGTGKGKEIVDPKQPHFIKATGNFGLAKSKGTLMGELGPELVVSNGRYFVVGQNGPEFVNLADDAIVFNHLQTKQLLDKGMSNTRGRAVTNERNAVAYAQGSINGGPAMSSASEMLAYLKQLREMWHKLTDLSIKDLTSTGGGGGGGGGNKEFLKQVERWYNLLQKIAELEEKITYEEQRRKLLTVSGIKDGKAYYASLKQSLAAMKEQVEANAQLAREQEEYFNKRRDELNSKKNPFNAFYTFDERGQLQYSDRTFSYGGKTYSAFEYLNEINKKNADGTAAYSPTKQLDMLAQGMGLNLTKIRKQYGTYTEYDDKGKGTQKTRTDEEILELLWKQMESDQSEMQSLHDSIKDYQKAVMEAQEKQAQIIKEMKDNQLAVEKDVYDAIVDMRERAIEEMRDLRDAYEDSTDKFITGLTNALDKERKMYETQQAESDLDKKRRRVAILQRTGGSGAEIASLQAEIESDEQDLYFEKQQQEIDAIQEAAEKQIEKLEQQIELEEELLEYQKEHGLLWQDVSKIMRGTSDEIVSFITTNNSEWWAKSPLATAQDLEDALFKAEQWTQFRDDDGKYFEEILAAIQRVAEGKQPKEEDSTASEEQQQEYNKKEGSKSIEEKSKYKVTYTDGQGEQQTRYFRSQKWADEFKKTHKKDYKDIKVEKLGTKNYWIFAHKLNWQEGDEPEIFGPYNKEFATMKTEELKKSVYYDDKYIKMEQGKYNKKTKKYEQPKKPQGFSAGGLNTTTGLAMLHGTPEKPEAVFNAEQTAILRNKILSNKPTSLLSLLQSLQGAMATAANNTTNINRSAATEIGSIALNMNVSQIANDYDAKRAGEQAMTEMLRIARKTNVTAIRG